MPRDDGKRLLKHGDWADDVWTFVADGEPLPDAGAVAVSKTRFDAEKAALRGRADPIGVVLAPGDAVEELVADLPTLSLIALEFPKFVDGRNYSTARLLRSRFGFEGEIRAVGQIGRDQFLFYHRCGIDAVEVDGRESPETWTAALSAIAGVYQPAADRRGPGHP